MGKVYSFTSSFFVMLCAKKLSKLANAAQSHSIKWHVFIETQCTFL